MHKQLAALLVTNGLDLFIRPCKAKVKFFSSRRASRVSPGPGKILFFRPSTN